MACGEIASMHWAKLAESIARVLGTDNPAYQAARTAARSGRADHFVRANQLLQCYPDPVRAEIERIAASGEVFPHL
jgi:hypothetical protein